MMESIQEGVPAEQTVVNPTKDVGGEGITVAVRVRPMNSKNENSMKSCWKAHTKYGAISQLNDKGEPLAGQNAVFNVDQVFDDTATTNELYKKVCSKIVTSVVNGINGTIFAYGQTSSGKTHTMQGGGNEVGVLQFAAEEIFSIIETQPEKDFTLRVSYMEIYNENLRDLMSSDIKGGGEVHIREDPVKGIIIQCKEERVHSFADIQQCLRRGEKHRVVGATAMNEHSSRSHAIFRLTIESHTCNQHDEVSVRTASLNLVDLAGSESVKNTGATGQRLKEGGKINQSLLALSTVIKQLADGGGHVNFRDSKLTRLLQPMLLGNASMAMICCITPADQYAEETRSTLQFATRAKAVRLNPEINEVLDKDSIMKKMKREIQELKNQLELANQGRDNAGGGGGGEEEGNASNMTQEERQRLLDEVASSQARIAKYNRLFFHGDNEGDEMSNSTDDLSMTSFARKPTRSKRHRETWCPGERGAPFSESMSGPLSPQPGPTNRRRLSEESSIDHSSSSGNDFQLPALEALLEKKSEELAESEAEKEAMYERLDEAEQECKDAQIELANFMDKATNEIAELQINLEEKDAIVAQLEKSIEEQKELYAEMETDQLDLVKESKEKDQIIASLESKVEALAANTEQATQLLEAETKINGLETLVNELNQKLAQFEKEKEVLATDKEGLLEDLEDTQQQLKTLKEANQANEGATKTQLDTCEARLKELEVENASLSTQLEELNVSMKSSMAEMEIKVETLEIGLTEKEESLESKQEEVEALMSKVEELEVKAEHVSRVETLLEEQEVSHSAEVEAMSNELSKLTDELVQKDEELQALTISLEEIKIENETNLREAAAAAQSALATELAETKAELEECKLQMLNDVRLLEQSKASEVNLERTSADAQRLRNDLTTRDVELKELRAKFDQLETDHRVLKETTAAKLSAQHEDDSNASSKKVSQQAAQITMLQADLNNATLKLTTAETQLTKTSSSYEKKIEKYESQIHEMGLKIAQVEELTFKIKGLETAVASSENRAKMSKEASDEAEKNLKQACIAADKFEREISELKEKLEACGDGNGSAAIELERLKKYEQESTAEFRQLEADKKSVEARLQKSKNELELLREEACRVGELQDKVAELETLLESHDPEYVEKLETSLRDLQLELSEAKKEFDVMLEEAKQSGSKDTEELFAVKEELSRKVEEMNEMSQQCMELDENMMSLESKMADAERKAINEEERAASLSNEMAETRLQLQNEIDSLKMDIESLKLENASMQSNNVSAESINAAVEEAEAKLRKELQFETDQILKEKDERIASLEKVKFTEEMQERFQKKFDQLKEVQHQFSEAQVAIKQKDKRIEDLEKVKMTREIQEKFTKILSQRDEGKKQIALMNAELVELRTRVISSTDGNAGQSSLLKKQLEEERLRADTLEKKVRAYVEKGKELQSKCESASHSVNILRVALKREGNFDIADLPQLSLDITRKANEVDDAVAKVQLLEEQLSSLNEDRTNVVKSHADTECSLERTQRERSELLASLQVAEDTIANLEAKLVEAKASQGKGIAELEKQLNEHIRGNKFLEQENLQLILENKDFKKQASAARCELEAMVQRSKKSPGSLGLAPSVTSSNKMNTTALPNKGTPMSSYAPRPEDKENVGLNLNATNMNVTNNGMMKPPSRVSAAKVPNSAGVVAPSEMLNQTKDDATMLQDENVEGCKQS